MVLGCFGVFLCFDGFWMFWDPFDGCIPLDSPLWTLSSKAGMYRMCRGTARGFV